MTAHPSECEEADVGSLCDCDCAGAKHAIRRTRGGVPGAGQVSRRAQQVAGRDGRASVVNNRAEPSGRSRRGPDLPPPPPPRKRAPARKKADPSPDVVIPPERKPAPVKVSTRQVRLSPTTTAQARKVRDALPGDVAGWKAAAGVKPDPAVIKAAKADAVKARKAADKAKATEQALIDGNVEERMAYYFDDIAAGRAGDVPAEEMRSRIRAQAEYAAVAKMSGWQAYGKIYRAHERWAKAEQAAQDAEKSHDALTAPGDAPYPIDAGTGYRMPSPELNAHLDAVTAVGRAALDDARRAWEKDPPGPVRDAQTWLEQRKALTATFNQMRANINRARAGEPVTITMPDGTDRTFDDYGDYVGAQIGFGAQIRADGGEARDLEARKAVAKHQADTLRAMLAEHRAFGGQRHTDVTAERDTVLEAQSTKHGVAEPRPDYRQRLAVAEDHFPADWVRASAAKPLKVGASRRAYYGGGASLDLLSMPSTEHDNRDIDGALHYIDEVNVHEFGHRMERIIPGLTHLEFAYVRRRGILADGSVQPIAHIAGYEDRTEVAQEDKWGSPYAGKTYERSRDRERPGDSSWEVFQVGLQDTFGRSSRRFGPTDDPDELQAFTIGALLTLG